MTKELEALEEIRDFRYGKDKLLVCQTEMYSTIKKALQLLESIENANHSEAFECLKNIESWTTMFRSHKYDLLDYDLDTIKQTLIKAYKDGKENERLWNDITTVNKQYTSLMSNYQEQKRVLEIIKKKGIDIGWLRQCNMIEEYNYHCEAKQLTQEEFELLKEVLK